MRKEAEMAFGKFVEQKWRDSLNVVAAEPAGWGSSTTEAEKTTSLPKKMGDAKGSRCGSLGHWVVKGAT
jgi:hypothetical protein